MSDPRAAILAHAAPETKPLLGVPGACIRKLTVADSEELGKTTGVSSSVDVFIRAVCDKDGKPLFTLQDAGELRRLGAERFRDWVREVLVFNGMSEEAPEEAEKNSEAAPVED